jgi:hypothetical protein
MKLPLVSTAAALALSLLALPAAADTTGGSPQTKAHSASIPQAAALKALLPDLSIKGLAPTESKVIQPVGLNPNEIKYMPAPPNAPPPVVKDGVVKCTFQVGASLANNGKNDANYANDVVVRNVTFTMQAKP